MLEVDSLSISYGKVRALSNLSITVNEGEVVSVLGANGAGKSTLVNGIVGLTRPDQGTVTFDGIRIDLLRAHELSTLGLAYGPEGGGLLRDMTVLENLELGAYCKSAWPHRRESIERVFELFPRLRDRQANRARTLSGGERQMLIMARCLMSRPRLCILDEPTIGLAPLLVDEVFETIATIRDTGTTVLLIEQNVRQSLEVSDRAYVLENGHLVLEGPSVELAERDDIARSYLGL